ncbi:hypothetical protein FE88_19740 [Azospirillum brasilense]|nr:hypothetical protein FE88_19740 [Azospirillum brasilense]
MGAPPHAFRLGALHGGKLEQREVAAGGRVDAAPGRGRHLLVRVGAPAIEDVVVVPHHHRGNARRDRRGFRLAPDPQIEVEVKVFRLLRHGGSEGLVQAGGVGPLLPGAEQRRPAPHRVGVELVAALQQQMEAFALMAAAQVTPQGVARRVEPGDLLLVLRPVAGDVGDPRRRSASGDGHRPGVPRRSAVGEAIGGLDITHAARNGEIETPDMPVAPLGEVAGRNGQGHAVHPQIVGFCVAVQHEEGGQPPTVALLSPEIKDGTQNDVRCRPAARHGRCSSSSFLPVRAPMAQLPFLRLLFMGKAAGL